MNGRRLRATSILTGVVLSALVLMSWSQAWYIVVLTGQSAGHPPLSVGGDVAAPAVAALSLAAVAACGAMAISGPFFRTVLAVLDVVLGACVVLSAALAISSPVTTVASSVTDATSVEGAGPIAELIGSLSATGWPWVALVAGILLAVLGVVIAVTGRGWPSAARRYEPVRLESAGDGEESGSDTAVSEWDELSGGADPTSR